MPARMEGKGYTIKLRAASDGERWLAAERRAAAPLVA